MSNKIHLFNSKAFVETSYTVLITQDMHYSKFTDLLLYLFNNEVYPKQYEEMTQTAFVLRYMRGVHSISTQRR